MGFSGSSGCQSHWGSDNVGWRHPSWLHREQAGIWDDSFFQSKCIEPHLLYQNHCHLIFLFILSVFSGFFFFLYIFQLLPSKKPRTKRRDGRETEGKASVKIENGKKRNQLGFLFAVWVKMCERKHAWTPPS